MLIFSLADYFHYYCHHCQHYVLIQITLLSYFIKQMILMIMPPLIILRRFHFITLIISFITLHTFLRLSYYWYSISSASLTLHYYFDISIIYFRHYRYWIYWYCHFLYQAISWYIFQLFSPDYFRQGDWADSRMPALAFSWPAATAIAAAALP